MLKQKSFLLPLNNSQPIVVTVVLLSVKHIHDVMHRHYTVLCKTNIVDEKFQLESIFWDKACTIQKLARKYSPYIFDCMIAHYNFYWISYTSKSFIWIGCSVFCFQQISRSCRSNNIFIMTLLSTTFWSTRKRWWTYTIIKVLVEWIKPFFLPCVYIFVSQNDSMHAWGSGMQCSSTLLNTTNAKSQFTT